MFSLIVQGFFTFVRAAQPMKKAAGPRPGPAVCFALAISFNICYTFLEKQNMRQLSGLRPPESLSRWNRHLHNGQWPHRIDDIIPGFLSQCKGFALGAVGFPVFYRQPCHRQIWVSVHTRPSPPVMSCRVIYLHGIFVFSGPPGRVLTGLSPETGWENQKRRYCFS